MVKNLSTGDIVVFGEFPWRVLDIQNEYALILSEWVIESRPYHEDYSIYALATWETSTLRQYLNNTFYHTFSDEEKRWITDSLVVNNDNPWYGTAGGNATIDRVFLLDIDEVVKYFGDSGKLRDSDLMNGDEYGIYDEYNSTRIAYDLRGWASPWVLRSPGYSGGDVALVRGRYLALGGIDIFGRSVTETYGVRPAMWVDLGAPIRLMPCGTLCGI